MNKAYFIGIDIGTQGARVVLLDESGLQLAAREEVFPLQGNGRKEQSPVDWWESCQRIIPALLGEVRHHIPIRQIISLTVTSTSGTIIPLGKDMNPLHAAIMYSDPRSAKEALVCRDIAAMHVQHGYTAFNASSGLPKMRWFLNQFPEKTEALHKFIHAADFIAGRLCGNYDVTDYTNALKSGYDIHRLVWPQYISEHIGIREEWLQEVRPSGAPLGKLKPALAEAWGLPQDLMVTTGITDGCASQVASGAVSPGQWNTTIGTTLVIKGVTRQEIKDPAGAIYNHRHPAGFWMPGGASNTGADWVSHFFRNDNLQILAQEAAAHLPAAALAWPLLQQGERFPFFSPQAKGFWPEGDRLEKFIACMEGVAFVERYAYERITSLSGEKAQQVFSAGGGSNSDTWLLIRSCVLNIPVCKMQNVSGAAGAGILAASRSYYQNLQEAAAAMVTPEATINPDKSLSAVYENKYQLFLDELKDRNIIE